MKMRWEQHRINALIIPPYPTVAFKAENADEVSGFFDYLAIFTALHYPVGVLPVSEVLSGEDDPNRYQDGVNDNWTRAIQNDMKGTRGMPVSVSVVGYPYEDELVLGVMRAIEEAVSFKKHPNL